MTPTLEELARGMTARAAMAVMHLTGDFSPPPAAISRQSVAALWQRHPRLVEREWQDGCAQCTYYRLTPLGLTLRAYLEKTHG